MSPTTYIHCSLPCTQFWRNCRFWTVNQQQHPSIVPIESRTTAPMESHLAPTWWQRRMHLPFSVTPVCHTFNELCVAARSDLVENTVSVAYTWFDSMSGDSQAEINEYKQFPKAYYVVFSLCRRYRRILCCEYDSIPVVDSDIRAVLSR
jgi:hypothetical protein